MGLRKGTDFRCLTIILSMHPSQNLRYSISDVLGNCNFLVLLGTGSLAINRSTFGDISITGDRTLLLSDSQTNNLTVQGTTSCSVVALKHRTIGGDATTH